MTEEKPQQKNEDIKTVLESFKIASERKKLGLLTVLEQRVD